MPTRNSPVVARYSLSAELLRLRKACGLTATDVARLTGENVATVTRRERGEWRNPDPNAVEALLEIYGSTVTITQSDHDEMLEQARLGAQDGWWDRYKDEYGSEFRDYIGLEHGAEVLWSCDPQLLPWILHTEAYTRAALLGRYPHIFTEGSTQLEEMVLINLRRQRLLAWPGDPLTVHAFIDQSTLHRPPAGCTIAQLHEQIVLLYELAQRQNVTVRSIPWEAGTYPVYQPITVLCFADKELPEAVWVEVMLGTQLSTDHKDIERIKKIGVHLLAQAMSPEETLTMLQGLVERPTGIAPG